MSEIMVSAQPKLLDELVGALSQASGGAGQLLHTQSDPRWLIIREAIDLSKQMVAKQAAIAARQVTAVRPS